MAMRRWCSHKIFKKAPYICILTRINVDVDASNSFEYLWCSIRNITMIYKILCVNLDHKRKQSCCWVSLRNYCFCAVIVQFLYSSNYIRYDLKLRSMRWLYQNDVVKAFFSQRNNFRYVSQWYWRFILKNIWHYIHVLRSIES